MVFSLFSLIIKKVFAIIWVISSMVEQLAVNQKVDG